MHGLDKDELVFIRDSGDPGRSLAYYATVPVLPPLFFLLVYFSKELFETYVSKLFLLTIFTYMKSRKREPQEEIFCALVYSPDARNYLGWAAQGVAVRDLFWISHLSGRNLST